MLQMFSDVKEFRRDPLRFFEEKAFNTDKPLVRLNLGPQPFYLVTDPDLIKPIFKADEGEIDKGRLIQKMSSIIGTNSLTMSGPKQRERRAAIHSQLARGIANSYVPQISALMRRSISQMVAARSFEAHGFSAMLALRVICETLFGKDALSSGDETALINAVHLVEDDLADRMFRIFPDVPWNAWRKRERMKAGRAIMTQVVGRARERSSNSSIVRSLEALKLSDHEMVDEILLIMLAGHHTTGSAAAWMIYFIATQPELARALSNEAATISNPAGDIDPAKLSRAIVSRAAAFETLRLYPSSYWYSRETKKHTTIGGVQMKAGTSLIVSPWHLHRDERHWDQPLKFDFTRSHMSNRAYVPFGVGPRACVGMGLAILELQLLALEIASSCSLTVTNAGKIGLPKPSITLVPPEMKVEVRPSQIVPARLRETA